MRLSADELARVDLRHDEGVVTARQRTRDIAELLGFDRLEQTRIATAVSELARNARRYAGGGEVRISCAPSTLEIEVIDEGPGIPNLDEILRGQYTSHTGLGRGLVGVRLLMDEFEISAPAGRGTRVKVAKRLPAGAVAPSRRALRDELNRLGARSPFEEVTRQNEELLQALGEVRARQQELVALNRELEETNQGVVALYAELDDRAERLRDADERKSRFLADMSHELRTPLNSVIALSELLLSGEPPLVGEQATQVAFIRRVAEDQLGLVGDLLDIAKIEAGRLDLELTDLSLAELFVILRGQLRPLKRSDDVELRFDCPSTPVVLRTDEGKLTQVLRNLVSNALKFTPSGEVLVRAEIDGDSARFDVVDTGIGIAAEDLPSIFDEFVQIPNEHQRRGQGTGLGLTLTRRLVALLGGELRVASELGSGTTFTVTIPTRTAKAPPSELTGAVLIVDDDETSRYVVEAHLRDTAWRTVTADGGAAALAALGASVPAAMILDFAMPDLDGLEVLRRVRADERTAQLPVIIHTSRLLEPDELEQISGYGAHVLDKSATSRTQLLEALAGLTPEAGVTEILLADDDDIGRYVIATMLRRSDFTVREAASGTEAVASALAQPPDLAILDVKMPGMDGFAACRRLKSERATRHIPVLMLSATFLETEAQVEGLDTGADAYLTQPVEAPVLAATVRSLLRARNLEAEVRTAASEWQTTFEAITDAVAVVDHTGIVERANRAFLACFGADAVGSPLAALDAARSARELTLGERIFSVRFDAVGNAGREVVTLSDVTAVRSALAAERMISRTLQQTLLPERLPERADLALDAWHVAAELELIVGGDWYDVIETRRGLWLVIGDVAGHGVAATAQAGQLRHSLRVYAHEGFGVAESVGRLNELLTGTAFTSMATMCIVEFSGEQPDSVRVVSAGHPPPLLLPADGPARLAAVSPGVVLGVLDADYVEDHVPFVPGDRLVLYTDGLVERPGEVIDDSLRGLVELAGGVTGLEPLRAHLVERLVGSAQPRDDVALLLAQRR